MLFVAPEFLLVFLPATLAGYWMLEGAKKGRWAVSWLLLASLVFYAWSGWSSSLLFLGSLCSNYAMGHWLAKTPKKGVLAFCVGLNLSLLGVFKYGNLALDTVGFISGFRFSHWDIRLPLAISFYTFQQIAYLVQCYRSKKAEIPWYDYALAVALFPHLIAGPLVHYRELVPQFHSHKRRRVATVHFHEGVSLFVIALAKKLLLADSLSPIAKSVFDRAQQGLPLSTSEAWLGALAYTFQIYFDFSAYSEMALGLGYMFGLRLPVNFRRPYLALDLRDFWRRWHITLSEFLRDYLYIPLGGNRKGPVRRWMNLFITMLLGGLWHGADWTFMVWGGLHGLFLAANHAWASLSPVRMPKVASRLLTFFVVLMLWVPFRAANWSSTARIWGTMLCWNKPASPAGDAKPTSLDEALLPLAHARAGSWDGFFWKAVASPEAREWAWIVLGAVLIFVFRSNLDLSASPNARSAWWALYLGIIIFIVASRSFNAPPGEFIYFRF